MRRSLAPALLALLLVTGCSGSDSDSASGASEPAAAAAADGGGQEAVVSGRVAVGPALIRTGELVVAVDEVGAAADEAGRLARGAGGDVQSEQRSRGDEDASAVVVLRLPPRAYDATVARVAALGDERSRSLGSEDVTDQVVDLDSRLTTQRASVDRVRALLERANTLGEVVQVEAELTKRTAELESLEARLAALEEQVDLGTLTVRLVRGDGADDAGGAPGFGDGLSAGWDALTALGRAVGVTAGALLPFAPLALLVALAVWRLRARRPAAA